MTSASPSPSAAETTPARPRARRPLGAVLLVVAVASLAVNLRPALTSVGPVLPTISRELGLGEGTQGVLGALPLLAFAVVSPLVSRPARRFGAERVLMAALAGLAVGLAVRSWGGEAGLWLGTAVLGCAIAVGNVLVPSIVKRDHSSRVARATGLYTACINVGASVASVSAVPLARWAGWRVALGVWLVPAVLVGLLWWPRARAERADIRAGSSSVEPVVSVWRQPAAWLVTAFMGLQSTVFYVMVTWLPTIEISRGLPAAEAGVHLFVFQILGIVAGLTIPRLMRPQGQVLAAVMASVPMLVGAVGLIVWPAVGLVWAVCVGLGCGASLSVALSLIGLRGRTHHETTQLSGMAQSVGYLLAALGPVAAGVLAERTGGWTASLVMVAVLAVVQLAVAVAVAVLVLVVGGRVGWWVWWWWFVN